MKNFASIAAPFTELTKKAVPWHWHEQQASAFAKLKGVLTAAPVLNVFDRKCKTRVVTDASDFCVGAILE